MDSAMIKARPRRGGEVDDGPEPDYRMSLAAERTYLAYIRTALAFLAGGIAVVGALPDAGVVVIRRIAGTLLISLGATLGTTAYARWERVDRAMRAGRPLPRSRQIRALTGGLIVVAVLAFIVVVASNAH